MGALSRVVLLFSLLVGGPAHALVILQYHHISDDTPASTSTSPALFRQHLELIADAGFEVIDLGTVASLIRDGRELPDKAVLITFDDSYSSIYTTAYPLLKARSWPFVVFANTQPVDQKVKGFMSWKQLAEMADNGAAIANHSVSHPHFVRRADGVDMDTWRAEARQEILSAEARIKANTGDDYRVLAFPFGEYDQALLDLLEALDFLGMSQASGAVRPEDALAMPRFPMGGRYGTSAADFMLKLRSLPMPLATVRIRNEAGDLLDDGRLPAAVKRPALELHLDTPALAAGLQCYASGQTEAIGKTVQGNKVRVQADRPLPAGRSRYNCTARDADSGRFHWFSQPFLRPNDDGTWPPEP